MNKLLITLSIIILVTSDDSFDWRTKNVVTNVKTIGSYTAAEYAFAIIGNLEGLYAIHYGELRSISAQFLIDCEGVDREFSESLLEEIYNKLEKETGIMFEEDYPYKGKKSICKKDSSKFPGMHVVGFNKYESIDEEYLKNLLLETGPLFVRFNGNFLQNYNKGILNLNSEKCSKTNLNHAGLLVGYGTENGVDYWIVKGAWGNLFGENGYFRIARGYGTCGINQYVVTAVVTFDN